MLLKFEHPTIDEMEVVKSLSPCVKFPVVAVYDPGSTGVLKEDLEKAEKLGLYSAIEWDSFSADVNTSEVKTLVSTGGHFSPVRWTHEKIDRSLKERLLRILFRNFVAGHEYDIVFGESDTVAKRNSTYKAMQEETMRSRKPHHPVKAIPAKKKPALKLKNKVTKGAKLFGQESASAKRKVKMRIKCLN